MLDSRGHYVKGLPREAFHVFEDDRAQAMTHFASEDVPLELIVALPEGRPRGCPLLELGRDLRRAPLSGSFGRFVETDGDPAIALR